MSYNSPNQEVITGNLTIQDDGSGSYGNLTVGGTINAPTSAAAAAKNVAHAGFNTTGTTGKMGGLGDTWTFTPTSSGKVLVLVNGCVFTATAAVSLTAGARYGTGTAPNAGDAVTGTAIGTDKAVKSVGVTTGLGQEFTVFAVLSLTKNTAYWFDIVLLTANASDAATVETPDITIIELR